MQVYLVGRNKGWHFHFRRFFNNRPTLRATDGGPRHLGARGRGSSVYGRLPSRGKRVAHSSTRPHLSTQQEPAVSTAATPGQVDGRGSAARRKTECHLNASQTPQVPRLGTSRCRTPPIFVRGRFLFFARSTPFILGGDDVGEVALSATERGKFTWYI